MDWMDYDRWPGPDEGEAAWDSVNSNPMVDLQYFRQQMEVNGGFSADGVTTHFEMRPDGTLVNRRPFTISAADVENLDANLRLKLEGAVGMRWYNPANSSWHINPL